MDDADLGTVMVPADGTPDAVAGDGNAASGLTEEAAARAAARQQLAADVEAFLADGGRIVEVPRDFRADPPRKPQNNYGKGSI